MRGILEDFPRLKIVASHGGGGICETISRMDYAYELQDEAFFLGPYAPMKIKHKPSHYLKKLYLDTVTYNPPAVKMVLDWVGVDHVLYGSDAPPLTSLKPRAIKLMQDLDIAETDREKIFCRQCQEAAEVELMTHSCHSRACPRRIPRDPAQARKNARRGCPRQARA